MQDAIMAAAPPWVENLVVVINAIDIQADGVRTVVVESRIGRSGLRRLRL